MRRLTLFIAYGPVLLVAGQVLVNLLSFIWPHGYYAAGFYLNLFFGTNILFALILVAITMRLRFCRISRWAAIAELLFAINYAVVKEDNLYNILFQVIVGLCALAFTFRHYTEKFPLCRMSLLISFLRSVTKNRSCEKGLHEWDNHVKGLLIKQHHEQKP